MRWSLERTKPNSRSAMPAKNSKAMDAPVRGSSLLLAGWLVLVAACTCDPGCTRPVTPPGSLLNWVAVHRGSCGQGAVVAVGCTVVLVDPVGLAVVEVELGTAVVDVVDCTVVLVVLGGGTAVVDVVGGTLVEVEVDDVLVDVLVLVDVDDVVVVGGGITALGSKLGTMSLAALFVRFAGLVPLAFMT